MKPLESIIKIEPTPGRIVWFYPCAVDARPGFTYHGGAKPLAAIIAHVWGDRMVNLTVFDSNGVSHSRTGVPLLQEGDVRPAFGGYCEWMPYQKGQAAKTAALEAQATSR